MKLISKLLSSFKIKKKQTVTTPVPEKNIIVVKTPEYVPTTESRVTTISSNDDLIFDKDGLPVNISDNAYTITKRNFTPSHVYAEPAFSPWAEQIRIKNLHAPTVANTTVTPAIPSETPVNVPDDNGDVAVYNGYPIIFQTTDGKKIAINNRGDTIFNNKQQYSILTESNTIAYTGTFIEVLNCDIYNKEKIINMQGCVLFV